MEKNCPVIAYMILILTAVNLVNVNVFESAIYAFSSNFSKFDITKLCALYGRPGHTFDSCPEVTYAKFMCNLSKTSISDVSDNDSLSAEFSTISTECKVCNNFSTVSVSTECKSYDNFSTVSVACKNCDNYTCVTKNSKLRKQVLMSSIRRLKCNF